MNRTTTTEIFELEQMLREANIPFEMGKMYDGYYITIYTADRKVLCDAVCHRYSHGYAEGMLEIMGGLTPEEEACDSVLGYLSAEEAFVRFQYCYEHNTPTYYVDDDIPVDANTVDLETIYNSLEVGDTVAITDCVFAAIGFAVKYIKELENKLERMRSILEE